ncbi:MAG: UDP-N-acetylmuramate dehydrogenase [Desulfobacterales bacterium]|nr:UDP-N-acetylmuramate dehydrogenase [Desulfobacterales bacterium]
MALDSDFIKWLENRFGDNVKFHEPMSSHTSLRVGGPAEALVTPENLEDLKALVEWSWNNGLSYLIIGEGTNLLIKDGGIRGIVIVLTKCLNTLVQTGMEADSPIVTASASVRMRSLCAYALKQGLEGMNFALGIPGTVGGGIMMNAGTSHGAMENVLESITVLLPTGRTRRIRREQLDFSYRTLSWNSELTEGHYAQTVILDGCFRLRPSDSEKLKKEARKILKARWKKQPMGWPSAGCFFKNPSSGKTAGQLIEMAGLKGKSIGGAEISSKHANFFINRHNASAADFLALMALTEETVSNKFNIDLKREVKIVGT